MKSPNLSSESFNSGVTERLRQDQLLLVVTCQVASLWLTCCLRASWVGARLLDRVFLFSRKGLAATPSTHSLYPFVATAHTAMSLGSRCFMCARFERLTSVSEECIPAGVHHDRDNAPVPSCSGTQLEIWPSIRDNEGMFGVTRPGEAQQDSSHNLGPQASNSFNFYLWILARSFKTGLSMCPGLCRKQNFFFLGVARRMKHMRLSN